MMIVAVHLGRGRPLKLPTWLLRPLKRAAKAIKCSFLAHNTKEGRERERGRPPPPLPLGPLRLRWHFYRAIAKKEMEAASDILSISPLILPMDLFNHTSIMSSTLFSNWSVDRNVTENQSIFNDSFEDSSQYWNTLEILWIERQSFKPLFFLMNIELLLLWRSFDWINESIDQSESIPTEW